MQVFQPRSVSTENNKTSEKLEWVRPTVDVMEIITETQAGGNFQADQDPNQPS